MINSLVIVIRKIFPHRFGFPFVKMAVWSSLSQLLVNSGVKRLLVSDAAKNLAKNGK